MSASTTPKLRSRENELLNLQVYLLQFGLDISSQNPSARHIKLLIYSGSGQYLVSIIINDKGLNFLSYIIVAMYRHSTLYNGLL